MNEVLENIISRRSVRKYKPDDVPKELIQQIVKAGSYAATGKNMQSPLIVAVTDRSMRDRLSKMNGRILGTDSDPFYGAPVVLIVLADKNWPTFLYDGSLVIGNMMLAAHSLGLSSCWIHRAKEEFESQEGKDLLASWGISGDYEGIGHCVVGYSAESNREAPPRKDSYIRFVE